MAYESLRGLIEEGLLDLDYDKAVYNYNKAVLKGIIKILSKMVFQQYNLIKEHKFLKL